MPFDKASSMRPEQEFLGSTKIALGNDFLLIRTPGMKRSFKSTYKFAKDNTKRSGLFHTAAASKQIDVPFDVICEVELDDQPK